MIWHLALLLALIAPQVSSAAEQPRCLNYHTPGVTDCQVVAAPVSDSIPQLPKLKPAKKAEPEPPAQPTLDDRVEEFMQDYGKPPREFVAFSLEPTLENALIWAQKYRDMMERNQRLTQAWQQAQQILAAREESGAKLPELPNELPPVPDFSPLALQEKQAAQMREMQARGSSRQADASAISRNINKVQDGRIGGPDNTLPVINVNYYFSAECPFCQKFEKEFDKVIKNMDGSLAVTCVDMTPSGQAASNIHGKLECEWRPVQLGEAQRFGVESTPTLIIDRGLGTALERVAGYVEGAALEKYLRGE